MSCETTGGKKVVEDASTACKLTAVLQNDRKEVGEDKRRCRS